MEISTIDGYSTVCRMWEYIQDVLLLFFYSNISTVPSSATGWCCCCRSKPGDEDVSGCWLFPLMFNPVALVKNMKLMMARSYSYPNVKYKRHDNRFHAALICRNRVGVFFFFFLSSSFPCWVCFFLPCLFCRRSVCRQQPGGPSEGAGVGVRLQEGGGVRQEVQVGLLWGLLSHKTSFTEPHCWGRSTAFNCTEQKPHQMRGIKSQDDYSIIRWTVH